MGEKYGTDKDRLGHKLGIGDLDQLVPSGGRQVYGNRAALRFLGFHGMDPVPALRALQAQNVR